MRGTVTPERRGFAILAIALGAVLGAAACYRGSAPPPPPAPAPVPVRDPLAARARDPLAFLPADSELVAVIDVRSLRRSPTWRRLEPIIAAQAGTALGQFEAACGFDPLAGLRRISFGLRGLDDAEPTGVIVVRGIDRDAAMACIQAREGVTVERGYVTIDGSDRGALTFVDASTAVVLVAPDASAARLAALIADGSPLRGAPAFEDVLGSVRMRDPLWFVVVGKNKTLTSMATFGAIPVALIASVRLGSAISAELRLRLAAPDEATRMAAAMQSQIAMATQMFEQLTITAEDLDLVLRLRMTQAQLDQFLSLLAPSLATP